MLVSKVLRRKHNARTGTALVEAALVLPVFIIFLFGMFEFGRYFMVVNMLKSTARSAARQGVAKESTNAEVQQMINTQLADITGSTPTIYIKDANDVDENDNIPTDYSTMPDLTLENENTYEAGRMFLVRIEIPFSDVAVLTPQWITGSATMSGQALMRRE